MSKKWARLEKEARAAVAAMKSSDVAEHAYHIFGKKWTDLSAKERYRFSRELIRSERFDRFQEADLAMSMGS